MPPREETRRCTVGAASDRGAGPARRTPWSRCRWPGGMGAGQGAPQHAVLGEHVHQLPIEEDAGPLPGQRGADQDQPVQQGDPVEATPRETVAAAVEEANAAVAAEVLDRVRDRGAAFLEHLVLDVLTAMGYGGARGSAEHTGRPGDEGLDGVIRQDALGLDRIY